MSRFRDTTSPLESILYIAIEMLPIRIKAFIPGHEIK